MAEQLNAKELVKSKSRREFLKEVAAALGVGAATGFGANYGLGYLADSLVKGIAEAERQVRETVADLSALVGNVERKLAAQVDQLEKHYNANVFRKYEALGIADPADIKQFEKILADAKKFEDYYSFSERAREFKDRIDRRILTLDEKLEGMQPPFMRDINDAVRALFGKPTGKAGEEYRKAFRQRLDSLCAIYDINENDRIAQIEVIKKINEFLSNSEKLNLSQNERDLYLNIKKEYEKEGGNMRVKDFIRSYNNASANSETLRKLKAHVEEAEKLYAKIMENKDYVIKLQGLLNDGIKQAEDLRSKSQQDFAMHRKEISDKIGELKGAVDSTIKELKNKGYDIETREDYINKGTFTSKAKEAAAKTVPIISTVLGSIAAIITGRYVHKSNKLRATNAALEEVVDKYNKREVPNAN
jgi:hypothetical protein